jgi:predicted phosphodiesterase
MRVLVISDIHANLSALETVFAAAEGEYDVAWCLGDVIGYGPQPNECVEMVRDRVELCVIGNHDWAVLGRPGINVEDFNPQARQAVLWTRDELNETNRAYLDSLLDEPVSPEDAPDFVITHASPREPVWEYILSPGIAMENFDFFSQRFCLVGHTHKPAIYRWQLHAIPKGNGGGQASGHAPPQVATVHHLQPQTDVVYDLAYTPPHRLILNPGSVGQPRDNDARAAYAILDLARMTWHYRRVAYPIDLTQSQMRSAGLPKRLIDRLSFGW